MSVFKEDEGHEGSFFDGVCDVMGLHQCENWDGGPLSPTECNIDRHRHRHHGPTQSDSLSSMESSRPSLLSSSTSGTDDMSTDHISTIGCTIPGLPSNAGSRTGSFDPVIECTMPTTKDVVGPLVACTKRRDNTKKFRIDQLQRQRIRELEQMNVALKSRVLELEKEKDSGTQLKTSSEDSSNQQRQVHLEGNTLSFGEESFVPISHFVIRQDSSSVKEKVLPSELNTEEKHTENIAEKTSRSEGLLDEMEALKKIVERQRYAQQELDSLRGRHCQVQTKNKSLEAEREILSSALKRLESKHRAVQRKLEVTEIRHRKEAKLSDLIDGDNVTKAIILDLKHELHELKCEIAVERIIKRRYKHELDAARALLEKPERLAADYPLIFQSEEIRVEELRRDQHRLREEHITIARRFQANVNSIANHYWNEESALRDEIEGLESQILSITQSLPDGAAVLQNLTTFEKRIASNNELKILLSESINSELGDESDSEDELSMGPVLQNQITRPYSTPEMENFHKDSDDSIVDDPMSTDAGLPLQNCSSGEDSSDVFQARAADCLFNGSPAPTTDISPSSSGTVDPPLSAHDNETQSENSNPSNKAILDQRPGESRTNVVKSLDVDEQSPDMMTCQEEIERGFGVGAGNSRSIPDESPFLVSVPNPTVTEGLVVNDTFLPESNQQDHRVDATMNVSEAVYSVNAVILLDCEQNEFTGEASPNPTDISASMETVEPCSNQRIADQKASLDSKEDDSDGVEEMPDMDCGDAADSPMYPLRLQEFKDDLNVANGSTSKLLHPKKDENATLVSCSPDAIDNLASAAKKDVIVKRRELDKAGNILIADSGNAEESQPSLQIFEDHLVNGDEFQRVAREGPASDSLCCHSDEISEPSSVQSLLLNGVEAKPDYWDEVEKIWDSGDAEDYQVDQTNVRVINDFADDEENKLVAKEDESTSISSEKNQEESSDVVQPRCSVPGATTTFKANVFADHNSSIEAQDLSSEDPLSKYGADTSMSGSLHRNSSDESVPCGIKEPNFVPIINQEVDGSVRTDYAITKHDFSVEADSLASNVHINNDAEYKQLLRDGGLTTDSGHHRRGTDEPGVNTGMIHETDQSFGIEDVTTGHAGEQENRWVESSEVAEDRSGAEDRSSQVNFRVSKDHAVDVEESDRLPSKDRATSEPLHKRDDTSLCGTDNEEPCSNSTIVKPRIEQSHSTNDSDKTHAERSLIVHSGNAADLRNEDINNDCNRLVAIVEPERETPQCQSSGCHSAMNVLSAAASILCGPEAGTEHPQTMSDDDISRNPSFAQQRTDESSVSDYAVGPEGTQDSCDDILPYEEKTDVSIYHEDSTNTSANNEKQQHPAADDESDCVDKFKLSSSNDDGTNQLESVSQQTFESFRTMDIRASGRFADTPSAQSSVQADVPIFPQLPCLDILVTEKKLLGECANLRLAVVQSDPAPLDSDANRSRVNEAINENHDEAATTSPIVADSVTIGNRTPSYDPKDEPTGSGDIELTALEKASTVKSVDNEFIGKEVEHDLGEVKQSTINRVSCKTTADDEFTQKAQEESIPTGKQTLFSGKQFADEAFDEDTAFESCSRAPGPSECSNALVEVSDGEHPHVEEPDRRDSLQISSDGRADSMFESESQIVRERCIDGNRTEGGYTSIPSSKRVTKSEDSLLLDSNNDHISGSESHLLAAGVLMDHRWEQCGHLRRQRAPQPELVDVLDLAGQFTSIIKSTNEDPLDFLSAPIRMLWGEGSRSSGIVKDEVCSKNVDTKHHESTVCALEGLSVPDIVEARSGAASELVYDGIDTTFEGSNEANEDNLNTDGLNGDVDTSGFDAEYKPLVDESSKSSNEQDTHKVTTEAPGSRAAIHGHAIVSHDGYLLLTDEPFESMMTANLESGCSKEQVGPDGQSSHQQSCGSAPLSEKPSLEETTLGENPSHDDEVPYCGDVAESRATDDDREQGSPSSDVESATWYSTDDVSVESSKGTQYFDSLKDLGSNDGSANKLDKQDCGTQTDNAADDESLESLREPAETKDPFDDPNWLGNVVKGIASLWL